MIKKIIISVKVCVSSKNLTYNIIQITFHEIKIIHFKKNNNKQNKHTTLRLEIFSGKHKISYLPPYHARRFSKILDFKKNIQIHYTRIFPKAMLNKA